MPEAGEQPGWKPDPEHPGSLRWWNGLGWSDARKAVDAATDQAREAARRAMQASTVTPQQVLKTTAARRPAAGQLARAGAKAGTATAATAASNSAASGAVVLAVLGLIFGLAGIVSLIALLLSFGGLVRSRRLARDGVKKTGFGQSLVGLILSVVGLIRWVPALIAFLQGFQFDFQLTGF